MSVSFGIPAVRSGLGFGEMLAATISYKTGGNGAFWTKNILELSESNQASITRIKQAAQRLAGNPFNRDVLFTLHEKREKIEGHSWELITTLAATSLLTDIPLAQKLTGSGSLDDFDNVMPVGSIPQKLKAASKAGYTTFLVSQEQEIEDVGGIHVYRVEALSQAWTISTDSKDLLIEKRILNSLAALSMNP